MSPYIIKIKTPCRRDGVKQDRAWASLSLYLTEISQRGWRGGGVGKKQESPGCFEAEVSEHRGLLGKFSPPFLSELP